MWASVFVDRAPYWLAPIGHDAYRLHTTVAVAASPCEAVAIAECCKASVPCFYATRLRYDTLREAMSCAVFIVSCFQYWPSCFYLLILLFLTRMHSLNSLCGWKSFSESFPVFRSASKLLSRVLLHCTFVSSGTVKPPGSMPMVRMVSRSANNWCCYCAMIRRLWPWLNGMSGKFCPNVAAAAAANCRATWRGFAR
jgi:hypothetical protein